MDTGTETDTSTGKQSQKTQTLASASVSVEKPSLPAPAKLVSSSSLRTLAGLLSLIQEDCRKYSETLAEMLPPGHAAVIMMFDGDGIIYFSAPPGHRLDTGKEDTTLAGHILLDKLPVSTWTLAEKEADEDKA